MYPVCYRAWVPPAPEGDSTPSDTDVREHPRLDSVTVRYMP